ncbi:MULTISPECIES: type II secretion system F family protein [unclassified Arsukibacterium]|mgnify:FL=1|uniref:type II secretion system F family protein n=1 Tax=unclassified Arsukibacterium TaxID=2635278 RepID=UPI000C49C49C|nr:MULTISPECIES: type II secretion system F family protein [unclassified Arsukibacterium]MAA96615.1 type II secretion system protein F [Rheinheimera sp.]MBM34947.1 type II secretion system protein F [Rheinheimera sp.]|tara:strand:+ start:26524 stop:27753 length:1230 start_codon:yes stop_codon:yes gene_type:complete
MAQAQKFKIKELEIYQYKGVNRRGKKADGELKGASIAEVKALLRQQGITPSKVKRKPKSLFSGERKITAADIAVVTRQIATMLGAGVPLVQSIDLIANGSDNKSLGTLMQKISVKIQSGLPLSEVLREHPKYFDELYCDLVKSGEQSGALDRIFDRIAIYKEKAEALKSKIKKAMFYPAAVLVVAGIVTSILLIFVVPQFAEIFAGFGAQLPAFTLFVLGISEMMQEYWWVVLFGVIAFGYVVNKAYGHNLKFRTLADGWILKAPVVGNILNKAAVARFARTLSTTFAAGVPLIEALESAAGASGNEIYRNAIMHVREEVSSGTQMYLAMKQTDQFPEMVIQMVSIGEESGALDGMLEKVANIYEQEVDDAVDGLTALLEPMIMAVLGVVIGGLIIAMYLPIFAMGSVV